MTLTMLMDISAIKNSSRDLIDYVDDIAEIHNTLRKGTSVTLKR
jgi:hypothetical protein